MSRTPARLASPTDGPAGVVLIRAAVGLIFLTQGILKFTSAKMGVERFTHIGFPGRGATPVHHSRASARPYTLFSLAIHRFTMYKGSMYRLFRPPVARGTRP
jgi:uncharacterized membrane protein YphA (DoxX/SURF4 family)